MTVIVESNGKISYLWITPIKRVFKKSLYKHFLMNYLLFTKQYFDIVLNGFKLKVSSIKQPRFCLMGAFHS